MVDVERNANAPGLRFILRPNHSLSWRGSLIFFLSLCVVSGTIATVMAAMGYWLVLPFAGIELLILGGALFVVVRRCHEREIISIADDVIRIERGLHYPRHSRTLARVWVRVVLERSTGWYPSRLLIRADGRSVEVGRFLTEEERRRLAIELIRTL